MDEQHHVALPKLYGAPAYARPPVVPVVQTPRPISPDDLPIEAEMTDEDQQLLAEIGPFDGRVLSASPARVAVAEPDEPLRPRPFSIRSFTDRIRRPR